MRNSTKIIQQEREYWTNKTEFEWLSEKGIANVLKLLPHTQGDVLELCSGSGMFTKHIQGNYNTYTCLDISMPLLDTLKKALPSIAIIEGNAEAPLLPPDSYDAVLVFAGLHHLTNITATLQNAHKLLRVGGTFMAFEPNKDCWYRLFMLPLRRLLKIYTEDEIFLSPGYLHKEMASAHFENITIDYVTPDYNPSRLSMLNKILAGCMKIASSLIPGRLGQSFFIISGRKK